MQQMEQRIAKIANCRSDMKMCLGTEYYIIHDTMFGNPVSSASLTTISNYQLGVGRLCLKIYLLILLCYTAPKMYSTNAHIMLVKLSTKQLSCRDCDYRIQKLTRSLCHTHAFLIALSEFASHQCRAVCLL